MGPLDLAMAGSSIFSGVGSAIDSGKSAGKSGDLATLRNKELVSSALVGGVGIVIALREKAVWPVLVAAGVIVLLVALHETHAANNTPQPDPSVLIGPWK